MYELYGKVASRAARVLWMLEELGTPYKFIQAASHSETVLAMNPSGKIPVFKVEDTLLTDSTAILTYLADKHQKLTFPPGSLERAQQDSLTHTILDEFDAVLWMATRHRFYLPEDQQIPELQDSLHWEFNRNLDRFANRVQGPFLQGETMTIADIIMTHCINWAIGAGFLFENRTMRDYGKRLRSRDAFRRMRTLLAE